MIVRGNSDTRSISSEMNGKVVGCMKKLYLLFGINVLTLSLCFAQGGTIRGKVTDENGEPAIAATVVLKSIRTIGASTNFDGDYTIKLPDSLTSAQILVVSYLGYTTIEEPVSVIKGQVVIKNFGMKPAAAEMKEVEVVGKATKAKEYYMEKVKMNSITTLDYVSAETMKKTGDANVTAAVARVPAVSTTSSGFLTVRGIGDRYVKTTINGSRIPTLDPFTNNIRLDLFPANLVDNIILTKTATADLPGDWAGAYISVETKEYPEKFTLNVETSVGYNNQTTFNDMVTSAVSPTDRLGYDNGFRDYNHKNFIPIVVNPTQYQELVALGLGSYYSSMGINSSWGIDQAGKDYFKLGLVQLGLLAPALFNDDGAVKAATNDYNNGPYKGQAFNTINAAGVNSAKELPNNWNTQSRKAPLDFSQGFSIGNQTNIFGRPFGFITGFRYGSSVNSDPNAYENYLIHDAQSNTILSRQKRMDASEMSNGWSALFNLAYKLNSNNSVSFLFMPNLKGVNKVRNLMDVGQGFAYTLKKSQQYESRKQLIYQFKSEHYLPGPKLKVELNASYTDGKSSAPDFKELTLYSHDSVEYFMDTKVSNTSRYYRYLDEGMLDSRIAFELPIGSTSTLSRKLKFGGAYQYGDRHYRQYNYIIRFNGTPSEFVVHNIDSLFVPGAFDIVNHNNQSSIEKYYELYDAPSNNSFGYARTIAGYVMADYALFPALRFSAGLRVEQAKIFTDVFAYDSLGYKKGDPRRRSPTDPFHINPGKLDELSYLPSATVVYKLKKDDLAPVNLRLNYSQTVARPSIRELSDIAVYDYELRDNVMGNSELKMVQINNYDVRVESYFRSGDNISLSLFYKHFKNHIDVVRSTEYTWRNADTSRVAGIELEGKKVLTRNFSFSANMALIHSESRLVKGRLQIDNGGTAYVPTDTLTRTMFGQAPYIVNAILSYKSDSTGLGVSVGYNIQGRKLVLASASKDPDIFEMPRHLVDIRLSKSLGKYFTVSLTARNVLDSGIRRVFVLEDGSLIDFDNFSYGTNYILGLSYKL